MKPLAVFTVGIGLLGFLVGALAGLSASPVVSTLLPLLFTLLTAGGGVWVVSGAKTPAEIDRQRQMLILGSTLVVFVIGFIPGLWAGIAAKLHPETIWFLEDRHQPAYGDISFEDARALAAAISLDERMEVGGLSRAKRRQILATLFNSMLERAKAATTATNKEDIQAIETILKSPGFSMPPGRTPILANQSSLDPNRGKG